jgi:hypothetical protein
MAPADILSLLRARPFIPFRIVTSDGTVYEVRHPDLVVVGIASCFIGYPDRANANVYERFDIVSMRPIVRLEPERQPVPSNGE